MKLIKPLDIVIIILVLAVTAGCWVWSLFLQNPSDLQAVVTVNGETVKTVSLSTVNGEESYTVQNNGYRLVITFYKDGAAVTDADCPDKICEKTGKLTQSGSCAICLPAAVTVYLVSNGQSVDTVAG